MENQNEGFFEQEELDQILLSLKTDEESDINVVDIEKVTKAWDLVERKKLFKN